MKLKFTISSLLVALSLFFGTQARSENLNEILNQISSDLETKKASTDAPAATQTTKRPAQTESRKPTESKRQSPKPQEAIVQPMQPAVPEAPRIVVYRASDKLPKDFRGQGLAGRFLVTATDNEGHPLIISAEDSINPFARQFWVVNYNAGLGPNRSFTRNDRVTFDVYPNKPLIFVGIFLPGIYNVRLQ